MAGSLPDIEIGIDAYATIADVEALNPTRPYNTTLIPTRLAVASFLNDTFHQLNAFLSILGYNIPVGSGNATAMTYVAHINALAAGAEAEYTRYSVGNAEVSFHAKNLEMRFNKIMTELKEGKRSIPGAGRDEAKFVHRADDKESVSQFDFNEIRQEDNDPIFTKNMDL